MTSIDSVFPKIPIVDSFGKKYTVNSKLFGQYTLIDFWFSHCGPCISTFPDLKNLYADYKEHGFEILGISVDTKENKLDWLKKINANALSWPQFWDKDYTQADKLGISMFPTNFLLDKNGRIIASDLEANQLRNFLKEHLIK